MKWLKITGAMLLTPALLYGCQTEQIQRQVEIQADEVKKKEASTVVGQEEKVSSPLLKEEARITEERNEQVEAAKVAEKTQQEAIEAKEKRNKLASKEKTTPAEEQKPPATDVKEEATNQNQQEEGQKPKKTLIHYNGHSEQMEVALTFDDGPDEIYTPQILKILRDNGVRATFYIVGSEARRHPEMVKLIKAEGHVIANHSWNHTDFRKLSNEQLLKQIKKTDKLLQEIVGGEVSPYFRPPYGALRPEQAEVIRQHGYIVTNWSVDTRDWSGISSNQIVQKVREQTAPGGIVLQHFAGGDRSATVRALPEIISYLQEKGYNLTTVEEVLR
ncbi:polysaccharide deacetylase family protein [Mechercharimyces sp. CAU 1602]|uniref:polysaccharide deacetylase family protein n=1 Tax=Mechercharimyces sp. CAU 1602 TaxID=2973933 RepID=UPI0021635844|nr:polysaccharide deacetylase family protein [Mechercharimyces sp. CAU 1602]MCS1351417.1 polysaccharide deacetylase family protein [Mechercharimyces sp. CAU 1602]